MNRLISLLALMAAGISVGCTSTPRNTYGTPYVAPAYPATTYNPQVYPATTQYVPPTYQPVPGPAVQAPQVVYQQPAVTAPPQIVYQQPAVAPAPQVIYQQPTVGYAPPTNYVTPASACTPCTPTPPCTCR